MAIVTNLSDKAILLEYDGGVVAGKQTIVRRRFNNVSKEATNENIYSSVKALVSLQEPYLLDVKVRDTTGLIEE